MLKLSIRENINNNLKSIFDRTILHLVCKISIAVCWETLRTVLERSLLGCTKLCSNDDDCLYGSFSTQTVECRLESGRSPFTKCSSSHILFTKCAQKCIVEKDSV